MIPSCYNKQFQKHVPWLCDDTPLQKINMEPQIIPFEETNHLANLQSLGSKCQISGKDTFFFTWMSYPKHHNKKAPPLKEKKTYTHPTFFFFCDVGPTPRRVFQATTFGGFNQHVPWVCRHVVYEGFHMIPEFCCEKNTTYTHMIVYIINIYICMHTYISNWISIKVMGWEKKDPTLFETKQGCQNGKGFIFLQEVNIEKKTHWKHQLVNLINGW